jgi:glycosyltransferase involved in cell wall biosynthesis
MNVGRTSPGIVFEKLIMGLSKFQEVDVLTADYDPSIDLSAVKNIIEIKRRFRHPRIYKFLISIFNLDPRDWIWAKKAISLLEKKEHAGYDVVVSFLSFHHYAPLITGILYTKKNHSKLAVHTVDAIPPPLGWSKNDAYFRGVKKMMADYLLKADFLFSTNRQMLDYQLSTFKPKNNLITEVIYNPGHDKVRFYNANNDSDNVFLYIGGIYGLRTPKYILRAFKKLLKDFPNSTLEFIGSVIPENLFSDFDSEERCKVIIHPFIRDLSKFYERATALIDIDAELPNDVFLSGKIVTYLTINRIIIAETGQNSPSRIIFKQIPSILQCDHNVEQLTDAMKKAILQKGQIDFNDRADVISLFDLNSVIDKLSNKLAL